MARQRRGQQPLERVIVLGVEPAHPLQPIPAALSPSGSTRQVTTRPAFACPTSPAAARMWMCLEIAASDISNGRASSPTVRSPAMSSVRIARRVGSASAAKIWSRSLSNGKVNRSG